LTKNDFYFKIKIYWRIGMKGSKRSSDNLKNLIYEAIRMRGMRLTPQRMAIVNHIVGNRNHPSADEIFNIIKENYPTISKATIYSTLELLVELGYIDKIVFQDNREARFDGNPEPHAHFICTKCGKIYDFHNLNLTDQINSLEKKGYRVNKTQIYIYGVCPECQEKEKLF